MAKRTCKYTPPDEQVDTLRREIEAARRKLKALRDNIDRDYPYCVDLADEVDLILERIMNGPTHAERMDIVVKDLEEQGVEVRRATRTADGKIHLTTPPLVETGRLNPIHLPDGHTDKE